MCERNIIVSKLLEKLVIITDLYLDHHQNLPDSQLI